MDSVEGDAFNTVYPVAGIPATPSIPARSPGTARFSRFPYKGLEGQTLSDVNQRGHAKACSVSPVSNRLHGAALSQNLALKTPTGS